MNDAEQWVGLGYEDLTKPTQISFGHTLVYFDSEGSNRQALCRMSPLWNYACVDLPGRAPWGFQLCQPEPYTPVQVHQVSFKCKCKTNELLLLFI